MAGHRPQLKFETSLLGRDETGEPRLVVWVRRFAGDEELTGRYEVFADLARLDAYIAQSEGAGHDAAALREARAAFAAALAAEQPRP
jgi:hypothetical protein